MQAAAEVLNTTSDAVRKRAKRGTLPSETAADGKLYVWVDTGQTDGRTPPVDLDGAIRNELVEDLRDRIRYLEEESRRKDHLLAAALERIPPQLEASSEPREAPLKPSEESEGAEGRDGQRRSWWSRLFSG